MKHIIVKRVVDYQTYKSEKDEVLEKQLREAVRWFGEAVRRFWEKVERFFTTDFTGLIREEWWNEILQERDFRINITIGDEGKLKDFLENIRTLMNKLVNATSEAERFVEELAKPKEESKEGEEKTATSQKEQTTPPPEEKQSLKKQEKREQSEGQSQQKGQSQQRGVTFLKEVEEILSKLSSFSTLQIPVLVSISTRTSSSRHITHVPLDVSEIVKTCEDVVRGITLSLHTIFFSTSSEDAKKELEFVQDRLKFLQTTLHTQIGEMFSNLEQEVISHLQQNKEVVDVIITQLSKHLIGKLKEKLKTPMEMKEGMSEWEVVGASVEYDEFRRFIEGIERKLETGTLSQNERVKLESIVKGGLIPALLGKVKKALEVLKTALNVADIVSEITQWKPSDVSVPEEGKESPEESPQEEKLSLVDIEGLVNELMRYLKDIGEEVTQGGNNRDKVSFLNFIKHLWDAVTGNVLIDDKVSVFKLLQDAIRSFPFPRQKLIEGFIGRHQNTLQNLPLRELRGMGGGMREGLSELYKRVQSSLQEGRRELHKQIKVKPPKKPKPIKKLPPLPKAVEQILLWWKNLPAESRKVISGILHSYLVETDPEVRKALERELVEAAKRLGIPIKALRALEDLPD